MTGLFVSFEGPDGAGKSTVIQAVKAQLATQTELPILVSREPGGSPIAEQIRGLILDVNNVKMDDWTEALLYAASRRQHLIETILPALASGAIVISDRYVDSSIAYQGGGRELGIDKVAALNDYAIQQHEPDLTLYLDIPVNVGLQRVRKLGQGFDRLEAEQLEFHERVRSAYLTILARNPKRIVKVDALQPLDQVVQTCLTAIVTKLAEVN